MGDGEERLRRVEEAVGFAEHGLERLADEVREMGRMIVSLSKRLERVESRLEAIGEEAEDEA